MLSVSGALLEEAGEAWEIFPYKGLLSAERWRCNRSSLENCTAGDEPCVDALLGVTLFHLSSPPVGLNQNG